MDPDHPVPWFPAWGVKFSEPIENIFSIVSVFNEWRPSNRWLLASFESIASEVHLWSSWCWPLVVWPRSWSWIQSAVAHPHSGSCLSWIPRGILWHGLWEHRGSGIGLWQHSPKPQKLGAFGACTGLYVIKIKNEWPHSSGFAPRHCSIFLILSTNEYKTHIHLCVFFGIWIPQKGFDYVKHASGRIFSFLKRHVQNMGPICENIFYSQITLINY